MFTFLGAWCRIIRRESRTIGEKASCIRLKIDPSWVDFDISNPILLRIKHKRNTNKKNFSTRKPTKKLKSV